jgi:hypothetical protein
MNTTQLKALLASYGRSVLAAATTLYMAGVTDPKDKAFGRLPEVAEVDAALKTVKPIKAPAKKAAVKKAPSKKAVAKKK